MVQGVGVPPRAAAVARWRRPLMRGPAVQAVTFLAKPPGAPLPLPEPSTDPSLSASLSLSLPESPSARLAACELSGSACGGAGAWSAAASPALCCAPLAARLSSLPELHLGVVDQQHVQAVVQTQSLVLPVVLGRLCQAAHRQGSNGAVQPACCSRCQAGCLQSGRMAHAPRHSRAERAQQPAGPAEVALVQKTGRCRKRDPVTGSHREARSAIAQLPARCPAPPGRPPEKQPGQRKAEQTQR